MSDDSLFETHDERGARLPGGVLSARLGPGANCSSAGSAIDVLFHASVVAGMVAVALAAAFPPRADTDDDPDDEEDRGDEVDRSGG